MGSPERLGCAVAPRDGGEVRDRLLHFVRVCIGRCLPLTVATSAPPWTSSPCRRTVLQPLLLPRLPLRRMSLVRVTDWLTRMPVTVILLRVQLPREDTDPKENGQASFELTRVIFTSVLGGGHFYTLPPRH